MRTEHRGIPVVYARARIGRWLPAFALCLPALFAAPLHAMDALDDDTLSGVEGEGLAFVLENMRTQMAPQSFIEEVGSTPDSTKTTFQRGDFYWFGASMTGDGSSGTQWATTATGTPQACSTTGAAGNLGCAVGTNAITNMAAFDNPYVLRVFPYTAPDVNNTSGGVQNTVLEIIGPTCVGQATSASAAPALGCAAPTTLPSDAYRWAFWGVINVTTSGTPVASTSGMLQDQTIIEGVPAAYLYPPMVATTSGNGASAPNMYQGGILRLFRTVDTATPANQTMGLNYISELSGNFRFSVGVQTAPPSCSPCTLSNVGTVPNFDNNEGLYFHNVQAFIPMGQLNYQSLTFNTVGTVAAPNGNFILEVTQIPKPSGTGTCLYADTTDACADFYSLENGDSTGYQTAHDAQCAINVGWPQCGTAAGANTWTVVSARYFQTHGYIEWGKGVAGTYTRNNMPNNFNSGGNNDSGTFGIRPYSPSNACSGANTRTSGCYTDVTDGMAFVAANTQTFTAAASSGDPTCGSNAGCTANYSASYSQVNIGTSAIEGLSLQHLKITTLGAN